MLSPRQERLRAACGLRQEERGPKSARKRSSQAVVAADASRALTHAVRRYHDGCAITLAANAPLYEAALRRVLGAYACFPGIRIARRVLVCHNERWKTSTIPRVLEAQARVCKRKRGRGGACLRMFTNQWGSGSLKNIH